VPATVNVFACPPSYLSSSSPALSRGCGVVVSADIFAESEDTVASHRQQEIDGTIIPSSRLLDRGAFGPVERSTGEFIAVSAADRGANSYGLSSLVYRLAAATAACRVAAHVGRVMKC